MSSPVTAQLILIQGDADSFQPMIELGNASRSIGRAQNCDIIWGSLQISRKHATLEYMVPTWYIRDTSTNGLSVNGIKLVKGELFPLKDTDIISFIPTGAVRYRFRYIVTASPTRGSPPARPTARSISPQPSTSNSALASSSTSISRSNVNKNDSRLLERNISDSSEDSNHSESLLSLDPPEDFMSFSADENAQSPSVDVDSDNASLGPLISKRKHKGDFSSEDSDCNTVDRKKKRMYTLSDDDDSSEMGSHLPGGSNFKTLRAAKSEFITEDQISKCDDLATLKDHLRSCMTKLKSTEVHLETMKCERTMEREEYRKKEHDVRSVNAAFKEETYKKILELMESELSCSVCNEVFIQATVIDCGHTFCQFCINEWARKKPECPICRKSFRNRSRHIEMENFISKIFESFTEEIAAKRKITIKERDDQAKKAVEDARAAATENQARGGNNFHAFIQTTAERYVDFLAELHQINEILGPRGNTAERRRSARIQDRVIDAVVAGAGGAGGAQGPVRGRYQRGRGRSGAAVGAANANPQGPVAPAGPQPPRAAAAGRQMPGVNPIPVVTLNDTDDGSNAPPVVRLPNIPNQFMNYVRRIPLPQLNLMGDVNRNGNNGAGPN